ncbi:hypothetical protein GFL49_34830 [Rhizobium leguminosarum bv. viciae]|nr:hypothetical protein [Rhizobium leguminosarum bv. viciae]
MTNANLSRSLEDVREAHRLLFAYYRRILDTVRLIGDQFSDHTFYHWSSVVTDPPPMRGTKPFDKWAWDFLPLTSVSFLYADPTAKIRNMQVGDWMLEVHVSSDSEFSHAKKFKTEPDPQAFAPAQASQSEIALVAWKCIANMPKDQTWLKVWTQGYWPDDESVQSKSAFNATDGIHSFQLKRPIEEFGSRSDVIAFTEAAKSEFNSVLGVQ